MVSTVILGQGVACVDVLPATAVRRSILTRSRRRVRGHGAGAVSTRSGSAASEGAVGTRRRGPPGAGSRPSRLWLPYVVVISALAAVSVFVPVGRARWLVPVGGLIALSALIRAVARSRGTNPELARHPFVLMSAGLMLTIASEVLAAAGGSAAVSYTHLTLPTTPYV